MSPYLLPVVLEFVLHYEWEQIIIPDGPALPFKCHNLRPILGRGLLKAMGSGVGWEGRVQQVGELAGEVAADDQVVGLRSAVDLAGGQQGGPVVLGDEAPKQHSADGVVKELGLGGEDVAAGVDGGGQLLEGVPGAVGVHPPHQVGLVGVESLLSVLFVALEPLYYMPHPLSGFTAPAHIREQEVDVIGQYIAIFDFLEVLCGFPPLLYPHFIYSFLFLLLPHLC